MAYASSSSSDYLNRINELSKPTYTSKYDSTISNLMDKIVNREDFSYDFNADPLYQNYKDQYTKLGNEAAQNAAASVSALTGGYGNSYAATAASQANQQYLTQLNNVIPDLYQAALDKYNTETENLYNQFDMYETEENRQYGQYRDNVSDYYSDLSDLRSGYSTALSNEQWAAEMAYQQYRDSVSDSQWQKQYDRSAYEYDTSRNDTNFWNNLNYLKSSNSSSKSGSSKKSGTSSDESAEEERNQYIRDYQATYQDALKHFIEHSYNTNELYEYFKKQYGDIDNGNNLLASQMIAEISEMGKRMRNEGA